MIELIPAIDLINGQCVRLTKGDYDQKKVYNDNPAEIAKQFEQMGFKRLHVVDLDGAKSKHIVNDAVLKAITTETSLVVDFGGGIKTEEDIEKAFAAGAGVDSELFGQGKGHGNAIIGKDAVIQEVDVGRVEDFLFPDVGDFFFGSHGRGMGGFLHRFSIPGFRFFPSHKSFVHSARKSLHLFLAVRPVVVNPRIFTFFDNIIFLFG